MLRMVILTAIPSLLVGLAGGIGLVIGYGGLGAVEGRHWPASSPMQVTELAAATNGHTRFAGTFMVLRADRCKWRGFDWRLGKRGERDVPVEVTHGPPLVRPNGEAVFAGWTVDVPPLQFMDTHADVLHDCGWPWLTRTPFWN